MNSPVAAAHGRRALIGALLCALMIGTVRAAVAPTAPLPEPLTLDYALSLADAPDPALEAASADVALAQARRQEADSGNGVQAAVQGRAFRIDPSSVSTDQHRDDNSVSLVLRKPLFDFGRTRASLAAAQAELQGSELRLLDAQRQRRLNIMARYFDVLLADLAAARDSAALAVADRDYQRAQTRQQLGQFSLIDLRAEQVRYLEAKRQNQASAAQCRAARNALADSLNHPGQPPATLRAPQLPDDARTPPAFATVLASAQTHNPVLLAQRAQAEAARLRVQAARAQRLPTLDAEAAASDYSRQTDERDNWRAGVVLELPLYSGGRTQAAIAARQAELQRAEAEYRQAQQELAQALRSTLDTIATLQVQSDQARAQLEYRNLALERSRSLRATAHDADLDAAQAGLSTAQLFRAQTDYQLALAWARLEALSGAPLDRAGPATTQPLTH